MPTRRVDAKPYRFAGFCAVERGAEASRCLAAIKRGTAFPQIAAAEARPERRDGHPFEFACPAPCLRRGRRKDDSLPTRHTESSCGPRSGSSGRICGCRSPDLEPSAAPLIIGFSTRCRAMQPWQTACASKAFGGGRGILGANATRETGPDADPPAAPPGMPGSPSNALLINGNRVLAGVVGANVDLHSTR